MSEFVLDFFLLRDPNVRWVVIAILLICSSTAIVGSFAFLRKRALIGDAVSHAILPGICLAFMLTGGKHPFWLMAGAILIGLLSMKIIDFITVNSRIKPDTALALVMSVFYGLGVLLLTRIQSSGNAAQAGLDKFLFGKAAAMMQEDVITYSLFSIFLLLVITILFKSFVVTIFDRQHAALIGLPVNKLEGVMAILTVIAIAIGIQAVGVVLMSALLITPAAAARYWTNNLKIMLLLAALFAMVSGVSGAFVSYAMPKMPTGPWIVMFLTLITGISVLIGSKKGYWVTRKGKQQINQKIIQENVLKALYQLGEVRNNFEDPFLKSELRKKRKYGRLRQRNALKQLEKEACIKIEGEYIYLTRKGLDEGQRITRLHRLWEVYLTKYLKLPADHVHEDAEAMEHLITPELEIELEKVLDYPLIDPHDSPIPRK
ncbi:metal ABC transporter permease [Algivirga pacifica]|uniref:Manganese ABC transporter permease MntC n=1 Tax=Algivirga pacifica TaxID=1162670 RepID=A0ABP9D3D9_9BACT